MTTETVDNLCWHDITITKEDRSLRFCQKPTLIWFTGLSGAGKSTIANALEKKLFAMGFNTYTLDGDNVRHGLCSDLTFSDDDRNENIRRVGEVAKLMIDAGFIILASFISPFSRERSLVRNLLDDDEFIEVYINTPLSVCEERDPKGLYKKARSGEIKNFTGIDSAYEPPEAPEFEINTSDSGIDSAIDALVLDLKERKIIY